MLRGVTPLGHLYEHFPLICYKITNSPELLDVIEQCFHLDHTKRPSTETLSNMSNIFTTVDLLPANKTIRNPFYFSHNMFHQTGNFYAFIKHAQRGDGKHPDDMLVCDTDEYEDYDPPLTKKGIA